MRSMQKDPHQTKTTLVVEVPQISSLWEGYNLGWIEAEQLDTAELGKREMRWLDYDSIAPASLVERRLPRRNICLC